MTFPPFWIEAPEGGGGGGGGGGPVVGVGGVPSGPGRGEDIWLDVASPAGIDRIVTPRGDWKLVSGDAALKQSLRRRTITNPGEWATKPDYGVGLRLYVKEIDNQATRDEVSARIRSQYLRDYRVEKVGRIAFKDDEEEGLLRVAVEVFKRSAPRNPIVVVTAV